MRQQQRPRPLLDAGDVDVIGDDVLVDDAVDGEDDDDAAVAVGVATNACALSPHACMSECHMFVLVALVSVVLSIEAMPTNVAIRALGLLHTVTSMWEMWRIEGPAEVGMGESVKKLSQPVRAHWAIAWRMSQTCRPQLTENQPFVTLNWTSDSVAFDVALMMLSFVRAAINAPVA